MNTHSVHNELQRLRAALAEEGVQALQQVRSVRQQEGSPRRHWFRSTERDLQAGENDGRWLWLEYSFPVDSRLMVLRWSFGQPPQLWVVDQLARHNALNPGSEILQPLGGKLPAAELRVLEAVMQQVPHSLWARIVKLVQELEPPQQQA